VAEKEPFVSFVAMDKGYRGALPGQRIQIKDIINISGVVQIVGNTYRFFEKAY